MKYLIIGAGSIGMRHGQIAQSLGHKVAYLSHRPPGFDPSSLVFSDLQETLTEYRPDLVFICNETSKHFDTLSELRAKDFNGTVLVEKPLFHDANLISKIRPELNQNTFVGFNLRYHPGLQKLKQMLTEDPAIFVNCYVGQYLPSWRPNQDYKQTYSASKALGGGALRDLSHELDYLTWMFGPWERMTALGGHLSSLQIDSDDNYNVLWNTKKNVPVSLQMNYLDRAHRRLLIVQTNNRTIKIDLKDFKFQIDNEVINLPGSTGETYVEMHKDLLSAKSKVCTFNEGLTVLKFIDSVETANAKKSWIQNN